MSSLTLKRASLALLAALALAGCTGHQVARSDESPVPTTSPIPAMSSATPLAVHVTSLGNGGYTVVTQMKGSRTIYSIRALSFDGQSSAGASGVASGSFEQPHVTFHDRSGGTLVADAPKADLTSADKTIVMSGGVEARTQDGSLLRCEQLRYDGQSEHIHGSGAVRLTTPSGLILTGDRIDGDVRLTNVRVSRNP